MGPSGLLLFLFFLFLSMGGALFPISLPMGTFKLDLPIPALPSSRPNTCRLPPDPGSCYARMERWYYEPERRQCQTFIYGGCDGNSNNFMTQEDCERACFPSPLTRPGSCPPPSAFPDKTCGQFCTSDDSCPGGQRCCETGCGRQCLLPVGAIRGYCPRRDPLDRPRLFCHSGCQRDADCAFGFPGRKCCFFGCRGSCVPPVEEHPGACPKMPVLQTFVPCNHTCADDRQCNPEEKCCFDGCARSCMPPERRSRCHLPPVQGPCRAWQRRYFYSPRLGRCRLFQYGGCLGNANNFMSRSHCERICGRSQPEPTFD